MARCHIRNRIRELRAVTRQTVFAIEKEKYSPSLEVAFRIAAVFGVSLESVFEYRPD